jgi:predicted kinase
MLGSGESLEPRIDEAGLAILFSVASSQLLVGVSVVVESNFDARTDTTPLRRLADEHGARIVQVHIGGDAEEIVEAFSRRAAEGDRHPGHRDTPADAEEVREKARGRPVGAARLPGRAHQCRHGRRLGRRRGAHARSEADPASR